MFARLLTVLDGERWKEVRSTVQPVFRKAPLMAPLILERVKILADVLGAKASKNDPVTLQELVVLLTLARTRTVASGVLKRGWLRVWGAFTLDMMASTVFGVEANAQRDDSSPFLLHANESINIIALDNWKIIVQILFSYSLLKLNHWTGWQLLFREGEAFFTAVVEQISGERGSNPGGRTDFIGLLLKEMEELKWSPLEGVSKQPEFGGVARVQLTVQEIAAQCFIFLAAGYDTSTIALQFITYNLALHQEVQDLLHDEIVSVLKEKRDPTCDDLAKMPYLEAVICETLRMYPPGLRCERRAGSQVTLGGVEVPKGTSIVCPILAIHHHPDFYPDPETFNPQRFMGEEKRQRDPLTFIPFGHGPRDCAGREFAMTEFKLALACLLPRFRFVVLDSTPVHRSSPSGQLLTLGV